MLKINPSALTRHVNVWSQARTSTAATIAPMQRMSGKMKSNVTANMQRVRLIKGREVCAKGS
jgi:hypothetical protein